MDKRRDAWQLEDDFVLAETVLKHIREGSTQLEAFEEAGKILNRTSAACGFRWNGVVRKKYEKEIKQAKQQRFKRKAHNNKSTKKSNDFSLTIATLKNQLQEKEKEIERLKRQIEEQKNPKEILNEDFKHLLKILEKAKSLGLSEKIS